MRIVQRIELKIMHTHIGARLAFHSPSLTDTHRHTDTVSARYSVGPHLRFHASLGGAALQKFFVQVACYH